MNRLVAWQQRTATQKAWLPRFTSLTKVNVGECAPLHYLSKVDYTGEFPACPAWRLTLSSSADAEPFAKVKVLALHFARKECTPAHLILLPSLGRQQRRIGKSPRARALSLHPSRLSCHRYPFPLPGILPQLPWPPCSFSSIRKRHPSTPQQQHQHHYHHHHRRAATLAWLTVTDSSAPVHYSVTLQQLACLLAVSPSLHPPVERLVTSFPCGNKGLSPPPILPTRHADPLSAAGNDRMPFPPTHSSTLILISTNFCHFCPAPASVPSGRVDGLPRLVHLRSWSPHPMNYYPW
ncbi:uncharacterized protein LY79DRAFT_63046 [Colletotrichum navitas]|uniref:Uncharacterized protein n=1 Tax=Colletotrichum navitas TaxID=681940 RepID=A0AAD8V8K7_9PEZI|nr:uncharacterized protein LY79DRAFT_63046 [Colletotrichum navitas]KAK1596388.1 hypothetical protein LY79DRAFT_63046 [Colletotrichum navitas]